MIAVDNSLAGGRTGAEQLLAMRPRPDACFAYNDVIAIGALQHLVSRGVVVPDDVSVVGFDDIAMCEAMTPRLTSVRIDHDLLGRTAVDAVRALPAAGGAPVSAVPPERAAVVRGRLTSGTRVWGEPGRVTTMPPPHRRRDGRALGSTSWNAGGDGPAWICHRQPLVSRAPAPIGKCLVAITRP